MSRHERPSKVATLPLLGMAALTASCAGDGAGLARSAQASAVTIQEAKGSVVPVVSLDRARVLSGIEQELYVLVRFDVPKPAHDRPERLPLNLALVIDRSGSMADQHKMEHAVDASLRLVDAMAPSDALGVVEYDNQITVLWPSSPLHSPSTVKALIRELSPRNSTNLAGGLVCGIDEATRLLRGEQINRVLLLSDGLANAGIVDPAQIARFAREARGRGIGVSTIGLGLDYNEDLMQAIAEAGGGNYYYVESPAQMDDIFQRELETIFTTIAQDVNLHFQERDCVREVSVLGYESSRTRDGLNLKLADLYGGEKRTVLLKLRLAAHDAGRIDLGSLVLTYTDSETHKPARTAFALAVEATSDAALVAESMDRLVAAEATLMATEDEHETYVRQYERGEKEAARRNITALSAKVAQANQTFQDRRLAKKLEQLGLESLEMREADLSESNRQMYLKGTKALLHEAKQGKRGKYMLEPNDSGYEVERLQNKLQALHLYQGQVTGIYDPEVARAVTEFQDQNGLTADGIAGPATLKLLGLY